MGDQHVLILNPFIRKRASNSNKTKSTTSFIPTYIFSMAKYDYLEVSLPLPKKGKQEHADGTLPSVIHLSL